MILRRAFSILFAVILPYIGWSQGITVVGLPHSQEQKNHAKPAGRTKAITLPFWEDFSDTKTTYANPDRWLYGKSIRVNNGMAIKPPSIGVATFDGIDSVGRPYNATDILAKGYADKLVSQSLDLTVVAPAERNSVYLSYELQMKGNGELPDAGDRLLVLFYDKLGDWVPVDTVENDGSIEADVFYTSVIQIADDRYYHEDFKFRIQNFARLSGPYDTWHVDYIYLNKGRTATDLSFPDRSISEPLTSLLGVYTALPISHFLLKIDSIVTPPKIVLTNHRADQLDPPAGQGGQPVNIATSAFITYRENDNVIEAPPFGPDSTTNAIDLQYGEFRDFIVDNLPDLTQFGADVDSLGIELVVGLSSSDNVVKSGNKGDYIPEIYAPIDFRSNDTTRASFVLYNKYAYDDGVAEYGAGLNQPGAQIAYEYNLVGVTEGTIRFLEMYFPRFGDESSQVIELRIWNDLNKSPIYTEIASLQRSEENQFWVKQILPVTVKKKFYIGWKQSAAAVIAAGLDKNSDTGNKMFYNTNGEWLQNTVVHGSLMLRPVFGEALVTDPNGLEDEHTLVVYPNPGAGTFHFAGTADKIVVYDMTGRNTPFMKESTADETIVTLPNSSQGIYVMKIYNDGKVRTAKVMVR